MTNEDAIKWLENLKNDIGNPHYECLWHYAQAIDEICAMLEEQEATMVVESENMYTGLPITHCPTCGKSLDRYLYGRRQEGEINFCPYCGQAVKWG